MSHFETKTKPCSRKLYLNSTDEIQSDSFIQIAVRSVKCQNLYNLFKEKKGSDRLH